MYETTTHPLVLIVGAGPTGLTLAIELARRGLPFRIIDRAASPFSGSRGKGIQPRTLEIFEDLGVLGDVLASGAPYPTFRFHLGPFSLRGGSLGTRKPPSDAIPHPNLWMVPQARTERILRDRLESLEGVVEGGVALAGFTDEGSAVTARLSNGETLAVAYLVGCDGGRSVVRTTLGARLEGSPVDEKLALVADVEVDGLGRDDWHVWAFGKGGPVSLCPLPGTQLFQLVGPGRIAELGIERTVHAITGRRVSHVAWSSTYRPQARMVDRYRVGRVLLAGDAAHVHPPAGGQGLNTGVQDAYNLGWKLARVLRGAEPALLDTYEAERLPVAAAVLGLSKRLHQSRSLKRQGLTNQLGLHYRESPLSSGAPHGSLAAGDRMPDARLANGSRLFEHLQGPQAADVRIGESTHVLVRPDGYIARIGSEAEASYFGEGTRAVDARGSSLASP